MNNDRLVEIMGAATTEIDTLRAQLAVARHECSILSSRLEVCTTANKFLRTENNNLKQWQEIHKKEIIWQESATH